MMSFLILSALLVVVAGLFVTPSLWHQELVLHRSQPDASRPQRYTAAALMLGLGLMTAGVYSIVGEPLGLKVGLHPGSNRITRQQAPSLPASDAEPGSGTEQSRGASATPAQIEDMVNRLAQRLQAKPDDPQGWRMLARSYETLGRFDLAVQAYQRLLALQSPDADLLTDYAVTLGMSLEKSLAGEPEAIINQALKLDPRHIQALALSGSAAFERQDYRQAVAQWQKLLSLIPQDDDMRPSIEGHVAKARALANQSTTAR